MRLAFCLFHYFPYGGLQSDFRRIISLCQQRGHTIDVYTMGWQGKRPDDIQLYIMPVRAFTNHGRCHRFSRKVAKKMAQHRYDAVIGFNRMPGLDIYFAADVCFAWQMAKKHAHYIRYLPRYHTYLSLEKGLFKQKPQPHLLFLTPMQQAHYQQHYTIADNKVHLLPPGISKTTYTPSERVHLRQQTRQHLGISDAETLLLSVGSHFATKGLARSLYAFAALPAVIQATTRFVIIGKGNQKPYLRLAKQLGILSRIAFLGAKADVLPFMLGADLFLHPAQYESAGLVLLEAINAGLGVITTADCGHGWHIASATAGVVLPSPFSQDDYNHALIQALSDNSLSTWQQNALAYVEKTDLHGLHEKAVDVIEAVSRET